MHDLILRAGTIHDGFGSPGRTADVAVSGGRIAAIGRELGPAARVIDVDGLIVAPGFVDPHSHSDTVPFLDGENPYKLLQGVTTEIVGNCGFSCAPVPPLSPVLVPEVLTDQTFPAFGDYFDAVDQVGTTGNLAVLVGHNTLRAAVAGMDAVLPPGALATMERLAAEAFEAGAVGLSSGLEYVPGAYADIEELIALARVARRWNLVYATHMRSESEGLADALDEAIAVARGAGLRLQVSHCKASGRAVHGDSEMLLAVLTEARARGVDLRADVYPYQAFGTELVALLPPVACEGGQEELLRRLGDPGERAKLRALAEDPDQGTGVGLWREVHPEDVQLMSFGKRLSDVLDGRDPWDVLCDLITDDPHGSGVFHTMHDDDVTRIMRHPLVSIGSDGGPPVGPDHPRTFGTFPVFLGTYVRERGVVPMPEAIRKITSATAAQFGLADRGWLGAGAVADVCVFDPETIRHDGTYEVPDVAPVGVRHVLLAGHPVIEDGAFTGGRHGRVLRR
ncbi:N-acyl-D-amino-acid deacylase family protein [Microtetraspora malaysiensis]|uniref:N-acyl-D-amino-acid deacylase family protein n=1 Tax=Microtetraspora malaysiensis TaxID=161358 RepID=UPI003D948BB4